MYPTYYCYPAFFYSEKNGISIEFPDLPGCLPCAESEKEAISNAKEALGIHLYGMEKDGDFIPSPSPVGTLYPEEGGVLVLVEAFMPPISESQNNKAVKKALTSPS